MLGIYFHNRLVTLISSRQSIDLAKRVPIFVKRASKLVEFVSKLVEFVSDFCSKFGILFFKFARNMCGLFWIRIASNPMSVHTSENSREWSLSTYRSSATRRDERLYSCVRYFIWTAVQVVQIIVDRFGKSHSGAISSHAARRPLTTTRLGHA